MKTKKSRKKLVMGKSENPVDFFRRVREALLEEHDNDIFKYGAYLREQEKKHKDRLVDIEILRKMGKNIPKKITFK